jgi:beta-N-acetylhexosaminidase
MNLSIPQLCGQLAIVGLPGATLPDDERKRFAAGERGGVILFKRNVEGGPDAVAALTRAVAQAAPADLPPLVCVDQEGGKVARLGAPVLALPAPNVLAARTHADFIRRSAETLGRELRALGFTMDFAPVVDVHSYPDNPVITRDRTYGTEPEAVARLSMAFVEGLAKGGVLSCAKHFPGHGDTRSDSHFELPRVDKSLDELRAVEFAPFRDHARAGLVPAMMTAHVVYTALDPRVPATLSRRICTDLLRGELGYQGVLVTDDLEMKAIKIPVADAAIGAVDAGCDAILVCARGDLAAAAHEALVREAEKSPAFRARCEQACARVLAMRMRVRPTPAARGELAAVFAAGAAIREELARLLGSGAA